MYANAWRYFRLTYFFILFSSTDVNATTISAGDVFLSKSGTYTTLFVGNNDNATGSIRVTAPGPDLYTGVLIGGGNKGLGTGDAIVSGNGATLVATNVVAVGQTGTGSLLINNGGRVVSQGGPSQFCTTGCNFTIIANGGGANGTLTVDGIGSTFQTSDISNVNAGFIIGNGNATADFGQFGVPANGFFNIINGATADTTFARLGGTSSSIGTALVQGPSSKWTINRTVGVDSSLLIGSAGSGNVRVTNGGSINVEQITVANGQTGRGTLSISGAQSSVTLSGQDIAGNGGARLTIGFLGSGSTQVFDGGKLFIDAGTSRGGIIVGALTTGRGSLDVNNGSEIHVGGTNSILAVNNGTVTIAKNSIIDLGSITGGNFTSVGGINSTQNGSIDIYSSLLNAGHVLGIAYSNGNTLGSGRVLLHDGGTVSAGTIEIGKNGLLGGQGTVFGNVSNYGGILQVGASPDALTIHGDFVQTNGSVLFDIERLADGSFINSTLIFDPGRSIYFDSADIYFNFSNQASMRDFINLGLLNINTFFLSSDGSLFSRAFKLEDIFQDVRFNVGGYSVFGFDPITGQIDLASAIPEPATEFLIYLGILFLVIFSSYGKSASLPKTKGQEKLRVNYHNFRG